MIWRDEGAMAQAIAPSIWQADDGLQVEMG